jgi:hypothetical protein
MIIHGNEVLEPEGLAELCGICGNTWAAASGCAGSQRQPRIVLETTSRRR